MGSPCHPSGGVLFERYTRNAQLLFRRILLLLVIALLDGCVRLIIE